MVAPRHGDGSVHASDVGNDTGQCRAAPENSIHSTHTGGHNAAGFARSSCTMASNPHGHSSCRSSNSCRMAQPKAWTATVWYRLLASDDSTCWQKAKCQMCKERKASHGGPRCSPSIPAQRRNRAESTRSCPVSIPSSRRTSTRIRVATHIGVDRPVARRRESKNADPKVRNWSGLLPRTPAAPKRTRARIRIPPGRCQSRRPNNHAPIGALPQFQSSSQVARFDPSGVRRQTPLTHT